MQPLRHLLGDNELTGRSRAHLIEAAETPCVLHRLVMPAFLAMREAARSEGVDLQAASSFRDFDRQLAIWNAKFRGERPLLDRAGKPLAVSSLPAGERVDAILLWSALPGASRHHWGTDLDVFDAAVMPDRSRLQLIPEEYEREGPFVKLTSWLDQHMHRYGFFRPYVAASGGDRPVGVSPEPWHLSFAPLAVDFLVQLTPVVLARAIESSSIEARELVLTRIEELHRRFVMQVASPPLVSLTVELGDHRGVV